MIWFSIIDLSLDSDLVKGEGALWSCLLAVSHACIFQTHFLTSCLANCFSAGEITVSIESYFIELENKADGTRKNEKRLKERWIEIILLRWYTYNRHGLYLWSDCFFRGMRKVPFQYNTDIHSALHAWNLKDFSPSFCLCSSLQMCCGLPIISPPPPVQIQWQTKTALLTALVITELEKTDLVHS